MFLFFLSIELIVIDLWCTSVPYFLCQCETMEARDKLQYYTFTHRQRNRLTERSTYRTTDRETTIDNHEHTNGWTGVKGLGRLNSFTTTYSLKTTKSLQKSTRKMEKINKKGIFSSLLVIECFQMPVS